MSGITNFTYDAVNRLLTSTYPNNQSLTYRRVDYTYNDSGDRTDNKFWMGNSSNWTQCGSESAVVGSAPSHPFLRLRVAFW